MYDPKDNFYWNREKIARKKELILEKPVRSAENVNLPKKELDSPEMIRY